MNDTLLFWEELKQGKHEVFVGLVTLEEIA